MTDELQTWLDTHWRAVCAPARAVAEKFDACPTLFDYVAQHLYPALLRFGYDLPLSVVVDLAYLYLHDPAQELRPGASFVLKDLAQRYCDGINQEASDSLLNVALYTAQHAKRQNLPRSKTREALPQPPKQVRRGEAAETTGILTFLELVASGLLRHPRLAGKQDQLRAPEKLRDELLRGQLDDACRHKRQLHTSHSGGW